ncbi:MAG: cryptochrome/photolyase family protein [Planctomycetota bacterium]|jgi:deoxyribodipyrimidine photolyase-related protein
MQAFRKALGDRGSDPTGRRWIFVPYDQLSHEIGPLAREDPRELGIVVIESPWKAARRPYHKQKLALVIANLRHFALEQAARGVAVRHEIASGPYRTVLERVARETGAIRFMEPAERELRRDLAPLVEQGAVTVVPHEGWLTSTDQFERAFRRGGPPWRMDTFYRLLRRETGLLMDERGKPLGGKLSLDHQNRESWKGTPAAPDPPVFPSDPIKDEVVDLVASGFSAHPGRLRPEALPVTAQDAERLWAWAKASCMPWFGPYEDAMSTRSRGLFHTRIAPLLNLHRLLPERVMHEALSLDIELRSKEGFLRQILGWREFVRHVHRAADGFRTLPGDPPTVAEAPGDGGYGRWRGSPWQGSEPVADIDGGAAPSHLEAQRPVPPAFWGEPSGLRCLDDVVASVWEEAYAHHIERLMVLSNLATLLSISPRELCDWFWVAYADAYDWVVEPNVLAMGTFATGPVMTPKPYVSGAAYINKMSDYCAGCAFDPKTTCPITPLYWSFLARNRPALAQNPRLRLMLASEGKRSDAQKRRDAKVHDIVWRRLSEGSPLRPDDLKR